MDEKERNLVVNKKVFIRPGCDEVTRAECAFPLQNTLLAGAIGSGTENVANTIIYNLTRTYSPRDIEIVMVPQEGKSHVGNFMASESRWLPHYANNYEDTAKFCFKMVAKELKFRVANDPNNTPMLFVVEYFDRTLRELESEGFYVDSFIRAILEEGPSKNIFVLAHFTDVISCNDIIRDYIDCFSLRLCTRASVDVSRTVLGCDIANTETKTHGYVWVRELLSGVMQLTRYKVDFLSEHTIGRYLKVNGKKSNK